MQFSHGNYAFLKSTRRLDNSSSFRFVDMQMTMDRIDIHQMQTFELWLTIPLK